MTNIKTTKEIKRQMQETASPYQTSDRATESLKIPPHSIEAEQSVLGGLVLDNGAWDQVSDVITEDDFYRADHRTIYRGITAILNSDSPCDIVTLSEWLENHNEVDHAGGLSYIATLAHNTPSAANIRSYANIVRERSILRQLISVGANITSSAFKTEGRSATEILDEAEKQVFRIAEHRA
ncbi:MAG: replicative DNA helicase, partial [Gammaproteobacteria bacterium]|nr:replicative DNA helicase [Gammaproteobacteria bacterium]